MLSSITPLGERGRNNRWALTAGAYMAGSALGGAAMGLALGAAGQLADALLPGPPASTRARLLALGVIAALGLVADLGWAHARVPTIRRQVDEDWIGRYRGWVYGLGYGLQLGLAVVTIVSSAITWVALAAAVLTGSWVGGLVVGAVFGAVRGLPVLLTAPVHHPGALRDLHRRNQRWAPVARRLALGGQTVAVAVSLLLALQAGT